MKKLFGVITAMTTPFDTSGKVDTAALEKQTEFLISKKVNALYPCGTTGEMYLMSAEERELVAETVVKQAAGRVVVYIHTGAMKLDETIRLSRHAHKIGADGVGVVTPSYFKMSRKAMVQYYQDVSRTLPSDFPIYVYAIPQLSGNEITTPVLQEISDTCANVVGIKYSYADMNQLLQYLSLKNKKFSVVFGPDQLFLPALTLGCDGTVSGCSGPVPEVFVDVYAKFLSGDINAARTAQMKAAEVVQILQGGSDLSIFKTVLSARGVPGGYVRKPLLELDEADKKRVLEAIKPFAGDRYGRN
jgi:4-hydroxy-tetrahydrodipicolinate synthase